MGARGGENRKEERGGEGIPKAGEGARGYRQGLEGTRPRAGECDERNGEGGEMRGGRRGCDEKKGRGARGEGAVKDSLEGHEGREKRSASTRGMRRAITGVSGQWNGERKWTVVYQMGRPDAGRPKGNDEERRGSDQDRVTSTRLARDMLRDHP